jgi:hypothetical protein
VTARAERKKIELEAKLTGLDDEFAAWLESSAQNGPLEKHHSQIRAVINSLRGPVESLRRQIEAPEAARSWTNSELELLRIHEVWNFFRQKFALRNVAVFRPYLDLADDFTWACYQPAQQLSQLPPDSAREPPLTFFGPVSAPFAIPRGSSYAAGLNGMVMNNAQLESAVQSLPIPVISVPWFQLRHLPDALVLAHEVGHHVEHDFDLTPMLTLLLDAALTSAGAPQEHRRRWRGWLGEVFADVYGALAAGVAYGQILADFGAIGASATAGTKAYPPLRTRVRVVAEALVRKNSGQLRDDLMMKWSADFPAERATAYDEEAAHVVRTLIAGPYPQFGCVPLTSLVDASSWETLAAQTATALLQPAELSMGIDVRCLLAAAGLAFAEAPGKYRDRDVTEAVLAHAHRVQTRGVRTARPTVSRPSRDQAAGQSLQALISALSHQGEVLVRAVAFYWFHGGLFDFLVTERAGALRLETAPPKPPAATEVENAGGEHRAVCKYLRLGATCGFRHG